MGKFINVPSSETITDIGADASNHQCRKVEMSRAVTSERQHRRWISQGKWHGKVISALISRRMNFRQPASNCVQSRQAIVSRFAQMPKIFLIEPPSQFADIFLSCQLPVTPDLRPEPRHGQRHQNRPNAAGHNTDAQPCAAINVRINCWRRSNDTPPRLPFNSTRGTA